MLLYHIVSNKVTHYKHWELAQLRNTIQMEENVNTLNKKHSIDNTVHTVHEC